MSSNLLLRESPLKFVNRLKSFDFALLFVHTLKLLRAPLAHFRFHKFFLYFEKHMAYFRAYEPKCRSRAVHHLSM